MASTTLQVSDLFADGTSVSAYPRSAWGVERTGAPSGSAAAGPSTVSGGTVTFTGLLDGTSYVAYAGSPDRYRNFRTNPAPATNDGGMELAYNEKTDADFTTTTTPTPVDIGTGTSISFVAGVRPVAIRFGASNMRHSAVNTIVLLRALRVDNSVALADVTGTHATAAGRIPVGSQQARMSGLTPGVSYTVKLQALSGGAGTMTIVCNVNQPIWIQAVEL